jgi:phosphohistidine phosphatase SixA
MRTILLALVLAMLGVGQAADAASRVYIMRHLQKAEGSDPPLSPAGASQAQALASVLARSGIMAIFATPTRRAMETAEPLAKRLGIRVTAYDPSAPGKLVEAAAAIHGSVLIVGHSNTVPDLVTRFGGAPAPVIGDEDYGTVFIVDPATKSVRQVPLPAK